MKPFEFDMQIKANSQEEALRKANAIMSLLEVLSVEEIERLAHVARTDPQKREMARRFLGLG